MEQFGEGLLFLFLLFPGRVVPQLIPTVFFEDYE